MGLTSLQVCMDSSDWLQGTVPEDSSGMDSSSPLSNDMLTCSRPLNMERRLRPQHDQALKCPRCDSTHTKFCYYNNYSLSQPRYFCKTCRRYWTKGGTLRNIPVGGGCRKNKKVSSSKKPNDDNNNSNNNSPVVGQIIHHAASPTSHNTTDLQLSFPDQVQFSHLTNLLGGPHGHPSFFEHHPKPIDFMESKLEAIVGNSRNNSYNDFMGSTNSTSGHDLGMVGVGLCNFGGGGGGGGAGSAHQHHGMSSLEPNFHGISCPHPFGMSLDGNIGNNGTTFMDTCQKLMLPYEANHDHDHDQDQGGVDVKPNAKILSLDWQDQGCSSDHHAGKDSFGYINGLGSWSNVMNNYGPSTTNSSLV